MPVWHELTESLRESGRLRVVGIVQEQHAERARLFAQWHGIDWPILWDPFNFTGSTAVPRFLLLDEHGVVRSLRADADALESFVATDFPAPGPDERGLPATEDDVTLDGLRDLVHEFPEDPRHHFRLGVALRLRHDSPGREPGDFAAALEHWRDALALEPNQYIWRRRLQQYGPRLDKPYPFYSWVDEARAAIAARGETPIELTVPLTGAERAEPAQGLATPTRTDPDRADPDLATGTEPDPDGLITRDTSWTRVDGAAAFATSGDPRVARVHLTFTIGDGAHWNHEAEPLLVWLDAPDGWELETPLLSVPNPGVAESDEPRSVDVEVRLPDDVRGEVTLSGYALFNACETSGGECVYRRRDFTIAFEAPE